MGETRRWMGLASALGAAALILIGCGALRQTVGARGINTIPPPREVRAPDDMPAFGFPPLTPPALMAHARRLASDEFEGRAPGGRGEELTIDYIARAFAAAGLRPGARDAAGAASWFQQVPLIRRRVTNAPELLLSGADGERAYLYGGDFIGWSKSGEAEISFAQAPLVFVGYGIVNPALGWNDYAGLDMAGKIAVILINDPDYDTGDDRGFEGRVMSSYGRWTYKFEQAARQGAAGALIVHEDGAAVLPWAAVRATWAGAQYDIPPDPGAPAPLALEGWLSNGAAREMFARAGLDFAAERARAQRPDFVPVPLGLAADLTLRTETGTLSSRNVIGVLPGRARPQEILLHHAHWDGLGRCEPIGGDDICNGAVDNATGVAGLIELARHFGGERPTARSVAFVAFTAREHGQLGAAYFAAHPAFPPRNTIAAININALNVFGAARDIGLIGAGRNDLDALLAEAAASQQRVVAPASIGERGGIYLGDQFPLAQTGIPVLLPAAGVDLYLGGADSGRAHHEAYRTQRYRKPDDEFSETWDMTGAMRDLQAIQMLGRRLAQNETWPNWREHDEFRAIRDESRARR